MISKINKSGFLSSVLFLIFTLLIINSINAQTTAFNFQGRLNDGGNAANGRYDLQFKLFDTLAGGNQVASTVDRANTQVINGVFSTVLDFGSAFTSGNRFLEIAVRPNGSSNAHVILGARQQILAVPFAAHSATSTNATNATNATNSLSLGGVAANNYARLNFANQGDLVGANIGANGYISVQGNALQPANSNGFPKIMLAVTADGTIARCYNGVIGASSGNCGGITIQNNSVGVFRITFPFSVDNRFWLLTEHADSTIGENDVISLRVSPLLSTNQLTVTTQVSGTKQNLPFHMFIF